MVFLKFNLLHRLLDHLSIYTISAMIRFVLHQGINYTIKKQHVHWNNDTKVVTFGLVLEVLKYHFCKDTVRYTPVAYHPKTMYVEYHRDNKISNLHNNWTVVIYVFN